MGIFGKFGRRKKRMKMELEATKMVTELERLCEGDKETYDALLHSMFLDPRKIALTMKEAAENAKKLEKEKDLLRARVWYEIAGGLALFEGNPKKVVEYFSQCEKISPEVKYPILNNAEKAVEKAQEYYQKFQQTNQ